MESIWADPHADTIFRVRASRGEEDEKKKIRGFLCLRPVEKSCEVIFSFGNARDESFHLK